MSSIPAFSAKAEESFLRARTVIRDVQQTEALWFHQGDPKSPTLPWMPFQPAEFLSIVFECVPEMKGREFLDVGCGPGTKALLARHFFGLAASGVEIDEKMASAASSNGIPVVRADALDLPDGAYSRCDLIWLYRPFRDAKLEDILERRIMSELKPGAILAGGAWENCPAESGWVPVVDDWELRRGAWMKPKFVSTIQL